MIKDIIQSNETVTPVSREMEGLKEYFPQCFDKDGSFDIERFREAIEPHVDVSREGRSYDFLGKSYARMLSSMDTMTVIRPDNEHNAKPENRNSENIYISGDNLDALHHLVKSYARQVKCIYIDPPYNTGTDGFVYNDKFKFTTDVLEKKLSISHDEAEKIIAMTSGHRASHAAWLTFMMPRLQLARDLLSKDGVIFISIDDNEQAYLKQLCDNIFGEDNFIACVPRITKRGGKSSETICLNHDYVLIYSRTESPKFYPLLHNDSGFKNEDEYVKERGLYKLNQTLDYDSLQYSSSLDYPIEIEGETFYPGGSKEEWEKRQQGNHDRADWEWRWSREKFKFGYENGFVVIKKNKNGSRIYTKTYQKASIEDSDNGYAITYEDRTKSLSTLKWTENEFSNDMATKDIDKTIGKKVFDHSKPISLLSMICELSMNDNDIILDFFSGSATTAEGVFWSNYHNNTRLRFIMVQLPEIIKENTAAYRKGYRTIDDIGIDRIKKAASLVKSENPLYVGDLGFKHYILEEVPEKTLDKMEKFDSNILLSDDNMLNLFGKEAVLATWLVRDGYGFGAKTEDIVLDKYHATLCGRHLYMVDEGFNEDDMVALVDLYQAKAAFNPDNIVLFGYSFGHNAKDMLEKNKTTINLIKDTNIIIDVRY